MKNRFCASLFVVSLFFSNTIFAQQTPADDVVKITTALIQTDIIVTDKKGNPVTDLKPEDFEIYENGKKQAISNFSFIAAQSEIASQTAPDPKNKLAVPVPTQKIKPENVRRTYALVVDDLGISFANAFWVKESLKKFVNEQMQPGDLVAVVRTGGGLASIQSFTSDKNILLAAIRKIKWNPSSRVGVDTFEPIRQSLKENEDGTKRSDGSTKKVEGIRQDLQFQQRIDETRRNNLTNGTLGSLNYIISGMKELPGRKSIMLFSQGFKLTTRGAYSSTMEVSDTLNAVKVLVDTANRAAVAIYTFDPNGLDNPYAFTAADEGIPSGEAVRLRAANYLDNQDGLRYLADETGGLAYVNQNDMNYGLKKAMNDQSYYLIGYQPDEETFDPKKNAYNKFEVKVNRPDVNVRYRSGFFAVADKEQNRLQMTPAERIRQALLSPFGANEVDLRLYTIAGNDPKNGDFIRSLINISAKDLEFKAEANGNRKANFDLIALTYGVGGNPVDQFLKNYSIEVDEKTYRRMLERGVVYDLPILLKKADAYHFRIAVRDSATGKVGSASKFIEVEKFKKNNLWVSNLLLESAPTFENAAAQNSIDRALTDTTLREFKSPATIRYACVIYNATQADGGKPQLSVRTRFVSDGKVVSETQPQPVPLQNQTDFRRIDLAGSFTLGNLPAGDYIFQVIVTDALSKDKKEIASQWIDFEIIR